MQRSVIGLIIIDKIYNYFFEIETSTIAMSRIEHTTAESIVSQKQSKGCIRKLSIKINL